MEEKMNALAELLEREPEFAEKLMTMGAEEAIAALNAKGVIATKEEVVQMAKDASAVVDANGELGEEALEGVAGGVIYPRLTLRVLCWLAKIC